MPPPAKKRKTVAGAVPVGTRRTTRSQRPRLSIDMIGKVASFVDYDDGDVMNICLAAGPKESAVVRHACLRNNMGYLEHSLKMYTDCNIDCYQLHANILCWMEVNTDWRKLCTKERTEDDELSTPSYNNEEGEIVFRTDPLIIFNNPALVIRFGIIDVLKHLVEVVGIDINDCRWGDYDSCPRQKFHLLYISFMLSSSQNDVSKSIFEYVVSREDVDVCALVDDDSDDDTILVWQCMLFDRRNDLAPLEAVVRHRSFDPNRVSEAGAFGCRPLVRVIATFIGNQQNYRTSFVMERVEILLKVGADPELASHAYPSPMDCARAIIFSDGEQSRNGKICKALISAMEKYIN